MKRILLFLALAQMTLLNAQTTNHESDFGNLFLEGSVVRGLKSDGISPVGAQIGIGYNVTSRFYPMITAEYLSGHYNESGMKTFYDSGNIGFGLGYTFLRGKNDYLSFLQNADLRVNVGTTIGHVDWKYNYYGVELKMGFRKTNTPVIGVGYRYMNSRTEGLSNYKGVFVTLGFKI